MKDAIIVALILAVALLGLGRSPRPQAAIEDTTAVHRASLRLTNTQGVPDDEKSVLQHCYPVEPRSETPTVVIGSNQEPIT